MNSENTEKDIDLRPVTKIIASYVGNHTLSPEQLPALIISVQQACAISENRRRCRCRALRRCQFGDPCSMITSSASNAASEGRLCGGISAPGTDCRPPNICGVGIWRAIIR